MGRARIQLAPTAVASSTSHFLLAHCRRRHQICFCDHGDFAGPRRAAVAASGEAVCGVERGAQAPFVPSLPSRAAAPRNSLQPSPPRHRGRAPRQLRLRRGPLPRAPPSRSASLSPMPFQPLCLPRRAGALWACQEPGPRQGPAPPTSRPSATALQLSLMPTATLRRHHLAGGGAVTWRTRLAGRAARLSHL